MRYFTLIFLLFSITAKGQTLQGVVTDADGKPLPEVNVVNMNTHQGTTTNKQGFYTVGADPGDVVAFTCVGFNTVKKIKPPAVIVATTNVVMEAAAYQLQEFTFRKSNLTQYQIDSAAAASLYKVDLSRVSPGMLSPVSAIAEKFNKNAKEAYRFQKEFAAGETQKFIDTRYTPEVVAAVTGFTGDTIGHFMYNYPMPYDFARAATDLELKMWIRSNFKVWKPY